MSLTETTPPSLAVIEDLDYWGLTYTVAELAMELDVFTTIAAGHGRLEQMGLELRAVHGRRWTRPLT